MKIRFEREEDYDSIRSLNDLAFGGTIESSLINKVRASCKETLSLVAVEENRIVGHIFFSPVTVLSGKSKIKGMGLGPMAVLPEFQNQGIGSKLVMEGLKILSKKNYPFVVVLGHKEYYPRFGFERSSKYGLRSQWDGVPDEAFMVLFPNKSVVNKVSGLVRYRPEFNEAM
ncbi:MAG: N-acetyltransferase [Deltaproteobacteria bacterium]|nr:N-acetyltransferase [Deltaproteobacteria bacterium]